MDAFSVYLPGFGEQFYGSVLLASSETAEVQKGPAVSGTFEIDAESGVVQDGITGYKAAFDKSTVQMLVKREEVSGIGGIRERLSHRFGEIDTDWQSGFVPGRQFLQAPKEEGKDSVMFKLTGGLKV